MSLQYTQEGLNNKEKKLNLCKIFSILILMNSIRLMTINRVKLGCAVSFI